MTVFITPHWTTTAKMIHRLRNLKSQHNIVLYIFPIEYNNTAGVIDSELAQGIRNSLQD